MLQARGRFAVVSLVLVFLLTFGPVAHSQKRSNTFPSSKGRALVTPRPCADGSSRPVPDTRRESVSAREADHADKLCAELPLDRNATASPWRSDKGEEENGDPVVEELKGLGEKGLVILRAREQVIEILEGQNRCAAWPRIQRQARVSPGCFHLRATMSQHDLRILCGEFTSSQTSAVHRKQAGDVREFVQQRNHLCVGRPSNVEINVQQLGSAELSRTSIRRDNAQI